MWTDLTQTQLVEPGDISFWRNRWKSDAFNALLDDPSTGYAKVLDIAAQRPWWFITPTHDYEQRHFAPWFGQAFVKRTYANPFIEDLYYWHDVLHALTFHDTMPQDENDWRMKMRSNEIAVSLESELWIYFRKPDIRTSSFEFEIWFDQIRNGLGTQLREKMLGYRARLAQAPNSPFTQFERELREKSPMLPLSYEFCPTRDIPGFDTIWDARRAASFKPSNAVEESFARYEALSEGFFDIWAPRWDEVERERAQFAQACRAGEWKKAVKERMRYWDSRVDENGVPHGDLARAA